jgi:hypothetical protein
MKAHGIACRQSRWKRGAIGGVVFAILAALTPKCPVCIAAWIGVIGLSGIVARVDARGVWLALAAAIAFAAALVYSLITQRRKGQSQ